MRIWVYQLVFLLIIIASSKSQNTTTQQSNASNNEQVTTMHMYFEPILMEERFTDMADEDNDALIEFWKESWSNAGWKTRILTRQDAEQHPDFQRIQQELEELRFDAFTQICFRRYLAMVVAGGGWLSDYDVYPLLQDFRQHTLPNNGDFTLFDIVVPDLVAAGKHQWESVLLALLDDARRHQNKDETQINFWTDTLGFYTLSRNESLRIHTGRAVMPGEKLLPLEGWSKDLCSTRSFRKYTKGNAVHFAPIALIKGSIERRRRRPKFRAEVAKEALANLREYCGRRE